MCWKTKEADSCNRKTSKCQKRMVLEPTHQTTQKSPDAPKYQGASPVDQAQKQQVVFLLGLMCMVHCELRGLAPVWFYPPMVTSCMLLCRRVNLRGATCCGSESHASFYIFCHLFSFFDWQCEHMGAAQCVGPIPEHRKPVVRSVAVGIYRPSRLRDSLHVVGMLLAVCVLQELRTGSVAVFVLEVISIVGHATKPTCPGPPYTETPCT